MTAQNISLQRGRLQHEVFESFERMYVEPAQERRPGAGGGVGNGVTRQIGPVSCRVQVVLSVVTVVETQKVVDASVVAGGRAPGMFPMPLERTQGQPGEVSGKIGEKEKAWLERGQRGPQAED